MSVTTDVEEILFTGYWSRLKLISAFFFISLCLVVFLFPNSDDPIYFRWIAEPKWLLVRIVIAASGIFLLFLLARLFVRSVLNKELLLIYTDHMLINNGKPEAIYFESIECVKKLPGDSYAVFSGGKKYAIPVLFSTNPKEIACRLDDINCTFLSR